MHTDFTRVKVASANRNCTLLTFISLDKLRYRLVGSDNFLSGVTFISISGRMYDNSDYEVDEYRMTSKICRVREGGD